MCTARTDGESAIEKELRDSCERNGNWIPMLESPMAFSCISPEDLHTIRNYGWCEHDLERMLDAGDADEITRLAAWIRESGECDHGMVVDTQPADGYGLDSDGNYPEACAPGVF